MQLYEFGPTYISTMLFNHLIIAFHRKVHTFAKCPFSLYFNDVDQLSEVSQFQANVSLGKWSKGVNHSSKSFLLRIASIDP